MADYYLDIETNPTGEKVDLKNDQFLTIQYQPIDCRTGEPKGDLVILKAWESSEKDILQRFYRVFQPDNPWSFVPVGFNLVFDYFSLIYRWRTIDIRVDAKAVFSDRPNIDLKSVIVLCNCGKFTGSKLGNFVGKKGSGAMVADWYKAGDYAAIEDYIQDETGKFLQYYRHLVANMPQFWAEYARANGIIE
jgi:hypothetical protein